MRKLQQNGFRDKVRKFLQNWFFQENRINFAYMATFSTSNTCQMWRISDFSTYVMGRHLKFLHMWRNFRNLLICYVEKLEISPHDIFFLHESNSWYSWQIWGLTAEQAVSCGSRQTIIALTITISHSSLRVFISNNLNHCLSTLAVVLWPNSSRISIHWVRPVYGWTIAVHIYVDCLRTAPPLYSLTPRTRLWPPPISFPA